MTLADRAHDVLAALTAANQAVQRRFPGDRPERQPIHTVYGGAQLFRAETPRRLGELALRAMDEYAPDPFVFARAIGLPGAEGLPESAAGIDPDPERLRGEDPAAWLAATVYARVRSKLEREAVEDFRIDFEDGFGARPDAEEDAVAEAAAREVARGLAQRLLPPFLGIRIKPLNEEFKFRSIRTLELFVRALVKETGGRIPEGFLVTLPKIPHPAQVAALVRLLELLEADCGLAPGAIRIEIMVELTQTLVGADGRALLPAILDAAGSRLFAAHFGTYDHTASCSITAAYQTMDHPACDFAKNVMQATLAGTGVFLSDGATNVMPVGPHRATAEQPLSDAERRENLAVVHRAWRLAAGHVRHSLVTGFYQGWDLHPAQLPVRYGTCYAFFLEGFDAAAGRLRNFVEKAAQATLVGEVFDDAATGQGLLNYFLRALNCGAVSMSELESTGLTVEEVQLRSFAKILAKRRERLAR